MLDDPVEVQALDPPRLRFAIASQSGQVRMFCIRDLVTLSPLWSFRVDDIPRDISFQGSRSEALIIHTCCTGQIESDTGTLIRKAALDGSIGSVAFGANGNLKAIYNLSTGHFDLYHPADSPTATTLTVPVGKRFIKQCAFAEEGRTLVGAGDNGTLHLFPLDDVPQGKVLLGEGPDAFYAVTADTTVDYHFIAAGESEEPATIFIWKKPTRKRAAENRKIKKLQADKETVAHRAAKQDVETKALQAQLAKTEELLPRARTRTYYSWIVGGGILFLGILLLRKEYRILRGHMSESEYLQYDQSALGRWPAEEQDAKI
ncbi:hypothetical protein R3P38DRAFT_3206441 [Favolaschia claudopus]|uniref:WD40 repeat-like protein n=1 Tax=Favolaschia claudopus TaxID=2862362 RepID=A0AAW0AM62_9AGAR